MPMGVVAPSLMGSRCPPVSVGWNPPISMLAARTEAVEPSGKEIARCVAAISCEGDAMAVLLSNLRR